VEDEACSQAWIRRSSFVRVDVFLLEIACYSGPTGASCCQHRHVRTKP